MNAAIVSSGISRIDLCIRSAKLFTKCRINCGMSSHRSRKAEHVHSAICGDPQIPLAVLE